MFRAAGPIRPDLGRRDARSRPCRASPAEGRGGLAAARGAAIHHARIDPRRRPADRGCGGPAGPAAAAPAGPSPSVAASDGLRNPARGVRHRLRRSARMPAGSRFNNVTRGAIGGDSGGNAVTGSTAAPSGRWAAPDRPGAGPASTGPP
ncbi:hypothetical protein ACU4GA_10155 [Methylobacterium oryzae CBMB20]